MLIRVRYPRVGWGVYLCWLAVKATALGCWWLLRRPGRLLTVVACFGTIFALNVYGPYWLCLTVFAVVFAAAVWMEAWPDSYDRRVERPLQARWRRCWTYRRNWAVAMGMSGLMRDDGSTPRLGRVRCTDTSDFVRARALVGQSPREWVEAAPLLAQCFGAQACRLHRGSDRRMVLELRRKTDRSRSWGGPAPSSGVPGRGTVGGVSAGWGEGGDRG